MPAYAHTHPAHPDPKDAKKYWEPLFTPFGEGAAECQRETCEKCRNLELYHGHLNKVAFWTAKFASEMFAPDSTEAKSAWDWGSLAGLWHDLGKFSDDFQALLSSSTPDSHKGETQGRVDHSTAGAQHTAKSIPFVGVLIAYMIAGHHAGLADGISDSEACLEQRLRKRIPAISGTPPSLLTDSIALPPIPFAGDAGRSYAFFARLLFSALVDADFLATEAFMDADRSGGRPGLLPEIIDLEGALTTHLDELSSLAKRSPVNHYRANIRQNCLDAANLGPGLFSLTVPTGGGKTLSSLAFALKHARIHNLRRVIYVIPYTSIIEQNAAVFRRALAALGPNVVLEHHSNFDTDTASNTSRLASENWDARVIVTTNVQFFESLHAHKTSRCRKLHRIARSVVILDEAQSLPIPFLKPCLRTIEELTNHYQTSVVLCTATQPAINRSEEFKIGLSEPREIIPDPRALYDALRRVTTTRLPKKTDDATLIDNIKKHDQALCIVNTRRHARCLFDLLPPDCSRFHLSALMCPEHRSEILGVIKQRLAQGLPVRLISTQLIEAGVDIDFPVVFRALAGLDSIAQAAGRCDREGFLTAATNAPSGQLFIFEPEKAPPPGFLTSTASSAAEVLSPDPPDPLALECIESYFRTHYWKHQDSTDAKHILDCAPARLERSEDLLLFKFKTCGEDFRIIDDYSQPVLIPYGRRGQRYCKLLRKSFDPRVVRRLARKLQRYTVAIPPPQHARLLKAGVLLSLHDDQFFMLNSDPHYSPSFGLHPEPDLTLTTCQSIL